ncbi:DUF6660 family protein [Dyadobacter psychrotolerans]|jgi:hypothetical protein|uniref:DUF6660 family protein n=1 Tax=Dyadobacter psychrotolerans TaxID=2541721 RepID=UPI0035B5F9C2
MRLAFYILSFYTVVLSCIPCQEEVLRVSYEQTTTILNTNADQQQGIADLCSPFCICACCTGTTLQEPVISLPEVASTAFFSDQAFTYTARNDGGELTSIWQPPRI